MDSVLERPFYFIVVLWGDRFRDYFLDYCLPSLLSPGNLPALSTRQLSKFLIATTAADWEAINSCPLFRAMQRYISPELIEIPPCPPGRSNYHHMGIGHKLACERAFRDAAYAMVLDPDFMFSDGTVARLQHLACSGFQLVIAPALRLGEEAFFGQLHKMGVLSGSSRTENGMALVITGRQMAYAAVNGLHNEMLSYEWDAPGFLLIVSAAWWRVPGENGILIHCLNWQPMLLDYGAIADHDTSTFDRWTIDGDYLFNNAKDLTKIHVVQDSDEMFVAGWGPIAECRIVKHQIPFAGKLVAKAQFGASYKSAFFDLFKRRAFFLPVRWHAQPLNAKWNEVEDRAMRELLRYVTPPNRSLFFGADGWTERLCRIAARVLTTCLVILRPIFIIIYHRQAVWRKLRQAARAEKDAIRQLVWYVRLFGFNRN